jgi:hypothetical protein
MIDGLGSVLSPTEVSLRALTWCVTMFARLAVSMPRPELEQLVSVAVRHLL